MQALQLNVQFTDTMQYSLIVIGPPKDTIILFDSVYANPDVRIIFCGRKYTHV